MTSLIIGISTGILIILLFVILKRFDKQVVYGLILTGIGFLYVGFTWTDLESLMINSTQAIVFLFLSYYGIKKSIYILSIGYFLHGSWDLAYDLLNKPDLRPPHYDVFCSSLDFIIGIYLLILAKNVSPKIKISSE